MMAFFSLPLDYVATSAYGCFFFWATHDDVYIDTYIHACAHMVSCQSQHEIRCREIENHWISSYRPLSWAIYRYFIYKSTHTYICIHTYAQMQAHAHSYNWHFQSGKSTKIKISCPPFTRFESYTPHTSFHCASESRVQTCFIHTQMNPHTSRSRSIYLDE